MKIIAIVLLSASLLHAEPEAEQPIDIFSFEEEVAPQEVAPQQVARASAGEILSEDFADQEIESFFRIDETPTAIKTPEPARETALPKTSAPQPLAPSSVPTVHIEPKSAPSVEKQQIILEPKAPKVIDSNLQAPPAPVVKARPIEQEEVIYDADIVALESESAKAKPLPESIMVDMSEVFSGSPTIYSILAFLSIGSFCVWLYTFMSLRSSTMLPQEELKLIREKLVGGQYDDAKTLCKVQGSILFKMVAAAVDSRTHGRSVMEEIMKAEGRRSSASLWQKIALLNDIAIIAPMLGLLGTVLGMFYAFYDLNRSMESISALFDGLGISVGTTVAGLVVAILAMFFHSMTKYRLIRQLNLVEQEASCLVKLIGASNTNPASPS